MSRPIVHLVTQCSPVRDNDQMALSPTRLTETWLCNDVLDSEILATDTFNVYRKDRNGNGGGVLIAIHTRFPSSHRHDLEPADSGPVDILVAELTMHSFRRKSAVVCAYFPQGAILQNLFWI